ncbi:aminoacyl-tRNA hydrolase [Desulfoferrobacter suflitae]|uniref:aminoacyl-tRNA hydrolase n=1 Tax=Desulfoferrobacter suflitae TaxID=2865782 RepID=UPI0021643106|nr:aminoacyl-tRNA hydrolase [Desulfoferrobacter suflitae]
MGEQVNIQALFGLGNPGKEYAMTRHNVGFQVLDRLAETLGISLQQRKFRANWGTGVFEGRKIFLFEPLTFMNRSGEVVAEVLKYFAISVDRMLVIHDDLDLPLGRMRLVSRGGAGGHRGVASIIQHLGRQDFSRMKLGIGRPGRGEAVESYVLQAPYPDEAPLFQEMVRRGVDAVQVALCVGLDAAMNRFNRHEPQV